jgi:RNA polymerase sigma factor (sigma-70 family)
VSSKKKKISEFYRSERGKMSAFVRRLVDDAADRDSEDVVQDVMLGLWNASDVAVPIDKLSAYVYRSLRNRVVDILRGRKKTVSIDAPAGAGSSETLGEIIPDSRYDAARSIENDETRDAVFEVLDILKPDEREIVFLTEFEGRTFEECSRVLGEPVGTLLSRKSRTMKKIRALLGEYEVFTEE